MRFIALSLLALAIPALAQVPAGSSWVRVVHASADAPAVDVAANGNPVLQGLRFKDYSDYLPVPAGTYTLTVNVSGTANQVLNSGPVTLNSGNAYTFYALGRLDRGTLALMGAGDDVVAPAAGSVRVRAVHAASLAPAVDIYATAPFAPLATPVLTAVPFPLAGPYLTVPAGNYQARVAVAGTKNVAIDSGRLRLMGGTVRTVVAVDPVTPGGAFELIVLPDVN